MFSFIKQVFVVLISFSISLATKCLFLNDKPCMVRRIPCMISLDKCSGSCNVLSPKICVPKETKVIDVKAFKMITNKNEAMTKHISCDFKWIFNSITFNSNQKWNNKTCQCEYKNYQKCKKDYSWNRSTFICENSKYLKSIADT